jgi:hypothetical protein
LKNSKTLQGICVQGMQQSIISQPQNSIYIFIMEKEFSSTTIMSSMEESTPLIKELKEESLSCGGSHCQHHHHHHHHHQCHSGDVAQHILYMIAVISNPRQFVCCPALYREFKERMDAMPGIQLVTVEAAYRECNFEVTNDNDPFHLQIHLTGCAEIWVKESLI